VQQLNRIRRPERLILLLIAGLLALSPQLSARGRPLRQVTDVRTDGTDLEQITDDATYPSVWPDVSADGSRIVYSSDADPLGLNPDHNTELFLYSPDTGETRQLTDTTTGIQYEPRIDGAGESVVFLSTSPLPGHVGGRPYDIYRVRIETGRIARVTGRPDPRETPVLPGGPKNNPAYSVAHRGRVVFDATSNSIFRNPDLSSELWIVRSPSRPWDCVRPGPVWSWPHSRLYGFDSQAELTLTRIVHTE